MNTRVLAALTASAAALRPSEQKVAAFVATDPQAVTRMSISMLAQAAEVSEPTVLRFCRALGYKGFIDFKLGVAGDLGGGTPFVDHDVSPGDDPKTVGGKLFGSSVHQMTRLVDLLDHTALLRAVEVILAANRIDVCGIAQSNFVAADLQHRLVRMGYRAIAMSDTHMQLQAAASLGPEDVAIIMSFAGQIRETIAVAEQARQVGATVIAITRGGSALADVADIVINVDSDEETFVYGSSATRFAHLLAVDILTTMVALRGGKATIERLRRSRLATQDRWIPRVDPEDDEAEPITPDR
ncbi:MAG: MurR/RpiR family transcriptional regulator [Hyphomicrobiales bacterium]|nr:MAG: MurR/RpiR family transcriptional regulator [Hyphomicrobiales bacterium]